MPDDRYLPGSPRKKLVKSVRRTLSSYGIRPQSQTLWFATWEWARRIAVSYWRITWPSPAEIAGQYLILLLVEIRTYGTIRLPYRASQHTPPEVLAILGQRLDQFTPAPLPLKPKGDSSPCEPIAPSATVPATSSPTITT